MTVAPAFEALDRAGLVYAVEEPAGIGAAGGGAPGAAVGASGSAGATIVLRGVATDPERLAALARAAAPARRLVVPEPLRFLYLGRHHVGQRWWVTGLDGEHEPATFGDALAAVERLADGVREQWGGAPLLVGHGQGGELALALALLLGDRLGGVAAVDAALPEVPGWELPPPRLDGLPVLLLPGAQPPRELERTRRLLLSAGARLAETPPSADAAALGPALDARLAGWLS